MTHAPTPEQLAMADRAERLALELLAQLAVLAERVALLTAMLETTNASVQDLAVTFGADDEPDPAAEALADLKPSPSGKH